MTRKCKAFTLIEIMIAMFMMTIVILGYFILNQSSNKSSMDAYYEMLCFSLAREPIEVFRGFGYETVSKIYNGEIPVPSPYDKLNEYVDIAFDQNLDFQYPAEAEYFQRKISLKPLGNKNGFLITVNVDRKGKTKAELWMRRNVELKSLILDTTNW